MMLKFSLRSLFIFVTAVSLLLTLYLSNKKVGCEQLLDFAQLDNATNKSTRAVFLDTEFHRYYQRNATFEQYCKLHRRILGSRPFLLLANFNDPGHALSKQHFSEIGAYTANYKGPGGTGNVVWVRDGKAIGYLKTPNLDEFKAMCLDIREKAGTGPVSSAQ